MACPIKEYIKQLDIPEEEKQSLDGIHNKIFKEAHDSKIFRLEDGKLFAYKNKYNETTAYIAKLTQQYGTQIARIAKITPTRSVLQINVSPLQLAEQGKLFDLNTTKPQISKELEQSLIQKLNFIGIEVTNLDWYKEYLSKQGENIPNNATAVADMIRKVIAYNEDNSKALPEEAAHFILAAMKSTDLYKKLEIAVVNTEKYKEVVEQYSKVYGGDVNLLKFEALGKLLGESIIKKYNEPAKEDVRLFNGLKSLFERFLNLFKRNPNLTQEIDKIAEQFLTGNIEDLNKTGKELEEGISKAYELDTEKYKTSTQLDSLKDQLETVVKKRITRLKILQNKSIKDYSTGERAKIKTILTDLNSNKITLGVINFINDIGSDTEAIWKRLNKAIKGGDHIASAKELRNIKDYVVPFNQSLKDMRKELSKSDGDNKEIISEISNITARLDDIEGVYKDESIKLLAHYLYPFAQNNTSIKGPEDLIKKLKEEKDISLTSRWMDAMAETSDDILGSIDRAVKESKERARMASENTSRELLALDKKLKDLGVSHMDFVAEKDEKGLPTGNFLTEFNRDEYKKARTEAYNNIKAKMKEAFDIELSDNGLERDRQLDRTKGARKEWGKLWKKFSQENTQANPKAAQILAEKEAHFKEIYGNETYKGESRWKLLLEEWKDENIKEQLIPETGEIYVQSRGELRLPAEKYRNKAYAEMQKDALKKEYYDKLWKLKQELDKYLPENVTHPYALPQVRKDWVERFKGNPLSTIKEGLKDLKSRESDTEFGDRRQLVDVEDKPVSFLPLFFIQKIKDVNDLSMDITTNMIWYTQMANDYREMNKIVHLLEIGQEVLAERKIIKGENALNSIFNKSGLSGEKAYEATTGGKAFERYKDWMQMVVYGKTHAEEHWLDKLGINTTKAVDMFNHYTSFMGLAANIYSAVNNVTMGNAMVRQEAVAKEFTRAGGLTYADKTYWSELGPFIDSMYNPYSNSKLKLVGDLLNILDNSQERSWELNTDRSRLGRMMEGSTLMGLMQMGEHHVRWRTALAMMDNIRLKDSLGKEIGLYEAFDVIDNKAVLKAGLKTSDGKDFTMDNVIDFGIRVRRLNQGLHGIYNEADRSAIQHYTLGRMALMFRKYIKPGINRRFDAERYDYSLDKKVEGMYRTTFNFIKAVLSDLKSVSVIYSQLEDHQKANLLRTVTEVVYMFGAALLTVILSSKVDDDEDKKFMAFWAYEASRLQADVSFYVPFFGGALQIVKSPMAGIRTVQQAANLINIFNSFDINPFDGDDFVKRYKSGIHKDEAKIIVNAEKLVPVLGNIERWFNPEQQLKYFNNPTAY